MADPVTDAANTISKKPRDRFLNPATNGDTKDLVKAITDLPAAEANQSIDKLEASGSTGSDRRRDHRRELVRQWRVVRRRTPRVLRRHGRQARRAEPRRAFGRSREPTTAAVNTAQ